MIRSKIAFWSIATGKYKNHVVNCVESARRAGIHDDFLVFTDEPIPGLECFDLCGVDLQFQMGKVALMKAAISRLSYDYFVFVDADTTFQWNPNCLLTVLGNGPIHVPVYDNADGINLQRVLRGLTLDEYCELGKSVGIKPNWLFGVSSFWIVKRDAIDYVYELCQEFCFLARSFKKSAHADHCLAFAAQMIYGDIRSHLAIRRLDLFACSRTLVCNSDVLRNCSIVHH